MTNSTCAAWVLILLLSIGGFAAGGAAADEGQLEADWRVFTDHVIDMFSRHYKRPRGADMVEDFGLAYGYALAKQRELARGDMQAMRRIERLQAKLFSSIEYMVPVAQAFAKEPNAARAKIDSGIRMGIYGDSEERVLQRYDVDPSKIRPLFREAVKEVDAMLGEWELGVWDKRRQPIRKQDWTLTDVGGRFGKIAKPANKKHPDRYWKQLDVKFSGEDVVLLLWIAEDDGMPLVRAVFFGGGRSMLWMGLLVTKEESRQIYATGNLDPKWLAPDSDGKSRLTLYARKRLDPDLIIGTWELVRRGAKKSLRKQRLKIRIRAEPGEAGSYVGTITDIGRDLKEHTFPGGVGMEIFRFTYNEESERKRHLPIYDLIFWSISRREDGKIPWVESRWMYYQPPQQGAPKPVLAGPGMATAVDGTWVRCD